MTPEEKEQLADLVAEVLRDPDPMARIAELQAKVQAGDEGEHGYNSVILALSMAMVEHMRR